MDFRMSLKELLDFEKPEDICQFEWGYWPETLDRWHKEGLPMDKEVWDTVGITYYHRVPVEVRIFPPFDRRVISKKDDTQIIQDENGIIQEVPKSGTAFPRFIRHPIADMKDFEELKLRLDPNTPGRFPVASLGR